MVVLYLTGNWAGAEPLTKFGGDPVIRFAICLLVVLALMCVTAPPVEAACGAGFFRPFAGVRYRVQNRQARRQANAQAGACSQ